MIFYIEHEKLIEQNYKGQIDNHYNLDEGFLIIDLFESELKIKVIKLEGFK